MNDSKKILAGILIMGLMASCGVKTNFTKNSYKVTPNPLEAKGDMVEINISGTVAPKSINAKTLVTFSPYLKTADGKIINLKSTTIRGMKSKASADQTVDTKMGGTVSYSDKIAYTPEMRRASLMPKFTVNGVDVPFNAVSMAEGVVSTAYLLNGGDKAISNTDDYKAIENNKSVNIYFPIDIDKFNPNYKADKNTSNKKQIADLKAMLKADKNFIVKGISINAYASPDGELARNANLSKGREESTYKFFHKELKKLGFTEVNDTNFSRGYTTSEDWKGFAEMMSKSEYSDRSEILSVVTNSSISDEERESLIRRDHNKTWEKSAKTILPKLRRSELVIKGATPVKTDAELLAFYGQYDKLDALELFHLSVITNDNAKKMEVLNAFIAREANDWRGFNDLAVCQMNAGDAKGAEANLAKAAALNASTATVSYNMAVLALSAKDYTNAEKHYADAAAKGMDVSYGQGCLAIKKGNYTEAVRLMTKSGRSDANVALAKLLNGDAAGAKTVIDNMNTDDLTWTCYYVRAICGARMNNQDVLTTNLARAVQLNSDARNLAKTDVEFISFFSNPLFEGAIR